MSTVPTHQVDASNDDALSANARKWIILAAGFGAGLLCGAFVLLRGSDAGTASAANLAPPSFASEQGLEDEQALLQEEAERLRKEVEQLRLKQELVALQSQLDELKQGVAPSSIDAPPRTRQSGSATNSRSATPASARNPGQRTLDFWNRMNDIIARESAMRMAPSGGVSGTNAGGFLDRRIEAAEFAATGINGLDRAHVDPQVVSLATEIGNWYSEEVQVSGTGKSLLEGGDENSRRGAPGKRWQDAEHDHRKRVEKINQRGAQLREQLSKKYSLNFPPLN